MADEVKKEASSSGGGEKNIGMAVLCYIWILVLVPLLTDAKNDPFVKFHIKQGLVLLIVWVISGFISWIPVINVIVWLAVFIVWIIGLINAIGGKTEPLPIIGKYADSIKI